MSGRRTCQFTLYILCLSSGLLFVTFILRSGPKSSPNNLYNQYNQYQKALSTSHKLSDGDKRPQTILLWNSLFNYTRWGLPEDTLGPDYFRQQKCPITNCKLTIKKDLLPSVEMYDAIVFYAAEETPLYPPPRRSASQYYVFALKEPPGETRHMLRDEGGFYNLTMTYRLDSDILWPYAFVEDIESGAVVAPAISPSWRSVPKEYNDEKVDILVTGKTKLVAWFVSHCVTLSNREGLAKTLSKYVDVDVFGACGPFDCPHTTNKCKRMLDNEYKFYLSFENSLCLDYVTEKFYNALKRQLVPVVFGGANYTRFAPPSSYINADDFTTVEELGSYLIYLHNHPKQYARYFWWRQYYRINSTNRFPVCDLCAKLNEPATIKKVQFYSDIENWWFLKGSCYFKSKIWF